MAVLPLPRSGSLGVGRCAGWIGVRSEQIPTGVAGTLNLPRSSVGCWEVTRVLFIGPSAGAGQIPWTSQDLSFTSHSAGAIVRLYNYSFCNCNCKHKVVEL